MRKFNILKIYKIVKVNEKLRKDSKELVHAYYQTENNGVIADKDMIYTIDEWNEIKERGYYVG